jgi:hypothetical protein
LLWESFYGVPLKNVTIGITISHNNKNLEYSLKPLREEEEMAITINAVSNHAHRAAETSSHILID